MVRTDLSGITDLAQLSPEDINSIAEGNGNLFANHRKEPGINTNQVRNVFSTVNLIKTKYKKTKSFNDIKLELVMLKPKMAYNTDRQNRYSRGKYEKFNQILKSAVDGVINSKDKDKSLTNFFMLLEGIVAYHKYFDEGNN